MKSLKKVFSSFVSLMTILWSVGGTLAFPSVASAATLVSGDLIKASGPAVYYYGSDGMRYVFPNEKTYFTWYSGFGTVKTITDAELAAISIGGNVTYRPGVKMVKITTDPKVYAVAKGGVLRHVPSEACATTLYGANWNTMIEDVPDGFFVNYSVGSPIAADCSDYDKTAEMNSAPDINTDLGASTSVSGSISASLASDTPAGVTVPKNAASVSLLKVNLTAGSAAARVTGLRIRRVGVGDTADFSNVYLYDANGTRITTGRSINSSSQVVEFNGLSIDIAANQTVAVLLTGDFSTPTTTGGQHAFELSDAASVILSGSGAVSGNFPVRGNVFTVGTQSAGRLDVLKGTTPANPTVGQNDVEVSNFKLVANTNDIEVRRINLYQAGDINAADLTNFKLYQGSTLVATASNITGNDDQIALTFSPPFVLEDGQTKTFSLHADVRGRSGRTIKTYVEYSTDVYAIDRLYNSGAAIDIATNGTFDGTSTNFITVTTQGGQLTTAFNGPPSANIGAGTQDVHLYEFTLTSSDSDLEIRKLRFRIDSTSGGLLEQSTTDYFTDIKVIDTDSGATLMGPTSLPATANSGTNFILTDTFYLNAGQSRNLAITADLRQDTNTSFVGQGFRVCLGGDTTATGVAAGTALSTTCDTETIYTSGDIKIVETGENLDVTTKAVPNTAISGNTLTVQNSSLSVALASTPSAATAVKKQQNIPAVGFVFTAGTESSAKLTSLVLTGSGQQTGAFTLAELNDVVIACSLWDDTTQIGTSQIPDATAGTMTFSSLNWTVPAGTSKTLTVKCTADSTVNGASDQFAIGIAATNVTAEDKDGNEITESLSAGVTANAALTGQQVIQTVQSGGVLTIAQGSQPQSTIVVAGSSKKLAEFTATAQYEGVTIDRINVTSTGQAANFTGVSVRVAGTTNGSNILPSGADRNADVTLTSPISVPKDGSVTFEVWGNVASITSSSTASGATTGVARSGATANLGVGATLTASPWDSNYSSSFNVRALGNASGDYLYSSGSATVGNAMTLRKTKPTITKQAVSTNTLSSGADTELYKFQITPDAAGEVRWKQIAFTVTTSSAAGATSDTRLNNFKLYKGSTQLTANTEVIIRDGAGNDITGSTYMTGSTSGTVYVILVNEETVSGSGTVYTLRATPVLAGTSNSVSTQFARVTVAATGYLAEPAGATFYGIDTANGADGTADVGGGFIWSDVSEPVHGFATGTGSSRDWTNDLYVDDMTQSQTLTRS